MNLSLNKFYFVIVVFLSLTASAKKAFPPIPTNYIYNETNSISRADERLISDDLQRFHRTTNRAMAVAFFKSLDGEDIDEYTNGLYRSWCGPDRKSCEGLLLVISFGDRRYRTEIGYGLEGRLTDLLTARVQRDFLVPALRAGRPADGVRDVIKAYEMAILKEGALEPSKVQAGHGSPIANPIVILFILVCFGFFISIFMRIFSLASYGSGGRRRLGGWTSSSSDGWGSSWGGGSGGSSSSSGGGFGGFSGGSSGDSGGGGSSGSW